MFRYSVTTTSAHMITYIFVCIVRGEIFFLQWSCSAVNYSKQKNPGNLQSVTQNKAKEKCIYEQKKHWHYYNNNNSAGITGLPDVLPLLDTDSHPP